MFKQHFQHAVKTSIYIPRLDIQCGCVEADLCLAMQMWGLKLKARLGSRAVLAAKLVISRKMLLQAHMCLHTKKQLQIRPNFLFLASDRIETEITLTKCHISSDVSHSLQHQSA